MKRFGRSTGNGAGWLTLLADSEAISQIDSVDSMKSSAETSVAPLTTRSKRPFEKHRQYSCTSRTTGLAGERQLPHAQLPPAPLAFRQITSARMKNPIRSMRAVTSCDKGTYGRRPRLATLTTARPPCWHTRYVSANTASSSSRYSAKEAFES